MVRRHDHLSQMALTLAAALLLGAVLEAEGILTWAQRLTVGPLRAQVLPLTQRWADTMASLYLHAPRRDALLAKSELAPAMLPADQVDAARAPVAQVAQVTQVTQVAPVRPVPPVVSDAASPVPSMAPGAAESREEPPVALPHEVHVVLAGDSMMAVGLAPTLKRWLAAQQNVHVIRAYRSGTGLARPEVFDWITEYPLMLGTAKPAIVIGSMGANDAQNVQVGKKVLAFGTADWDDYFRTRLTSYLDIVTRDQPQVLWIGLPEMRSALFAAKMAHLNGLIKATLERYPNTTWIDPAPRLSEAGSFQQFRTNAQGRLVKIRADDGIHLTDDGAAYLLDPIQAWFSRAVAAEVSMKLSKAPVRALAAVTPAADAEVPANAQGEVNRSRRISTPNAPSP
jgi:hypothetical protein